MGELSRRLNQIENLMLRQHVDRQMHQVERMCVAEQIPETYLPGIRRGLEEHARWTMAHAPLTPELVEAEIQRSAQAMAAELGIAPAELITEAERLAELYPLEM